jgi:hypothetical protein
MVENKAKKRKKEQKLSENSPERMESQKIQTEVTTPQNSKSNGKTNIVNQERNSAVTSIKAIKPIFVSTSMAVVLNTCKNIQLSEHPTFKVIHNSSTQIQCASIADKKIMMQALKERLINFHTFSEPSEKAATYVLKGFYSESEENITSLLQEAGVPVFKVSVLFKNEFHSLYAVSFNASSNINLNILNHTYSTVSYVKVKWESFKSKKKIPVQCHRCQRWGHTSNNCGFPYRCVKCCESHEVGKCQKKAHEGTPKCVNCNGEHSANHRGCDAFKSFVKNQERKATKASSRNLNQPNQARLNQPAQARLNANSFPPLSSGPSTLNQINSTYSCQTPTFSSQLKNNLHVSATYNPDESCLSEIMDCRNQLLAIPGINETLSLLKKLIEDLNKTSDPGQRVFSLIRFFFNYEIPNHEP